MIEIKEISKAFGDTLAVDGLSLEISEGEIFGFLGPNGAGKTTLLSMLCTMLSPDSGTVGVMGADAKTKAKDTRKSTGIVFQDKSLDEKLTGRENLEISAALYKVPKELRKEKIDELLEVVGLSGRADSLIRTYSRGMKRRLEIVRALIHKPRLLFLDEPTLGLDPKAREWVWEYLLAMNQKEGTTIVLATNYMEEAERLCSRVGIVDKGKMITVGTKEELKAELAGDVITLLVSRPGDVADKLKAADFIKDTKIIENRIISIVDNGENAIPKIVEIAGSDNIESIGLHRPTLNDVFLHHTGREIKTTEPGAKNLQKRKRMRGRRL